MSGLLRQEGGAGLDRAEESRIVFDPGTANEKQRRFFLARAPFIAYGGAKGGGKTWAPP